MPSGQTLIGRDAELAALVNAIDADRSTVVLGEAGIGKTAIVRAAVAGSDRTLHEGGAFATLRGTPYLALSRAVGESLSGDPAAVAARVEAVVGPDVLFVDDVQWADELSLAVLMLLVGRILILAAIRALDPGAAAAFDRLVGAGATSKALAPLDDAAARELVAQRRPELATRVVDAIVRRAGGNPLLLEEMAESGAASPVLARVMTGRLAALSTAARDVVEVLAVADRPLPLPALGGAVGEALEAGVAVERPAGVELRHQLVADAVRDGLGADQRRALHARVARILGDGSEAALHLAAAGRAGEASEMARRALAGSMDPHERAALLVIVAESSDAGTGLESRLEAGRALDEVADWAAVARVVGAADLDASTVGTAPEDLAEAHALLSHAAFYLGEVEAARRHALEMNEIALRPGSPAAVRCAVEAATFLVNVDGAVAEAIGRLDAAIADLPQGDAAVADLAVLKSSILMLATGGGDGDLVRTAADAAFAAGRYRTATDRARIVQYLLLMAVSADAALEFLLECHARYEAAGMQSMASDFLADAVLAALLAGRLSEAVTTADRLLEAPASPLARQRAAIQRARALVMLGRIDEGERALEALRPAVSADYFGLGETLHGMAEAALHGGRPTDAERRVDAALAVTSPLPGGRVPLLVTRAWARFESGRAPDTAIDGPLSPSVEGGRHEVVGLQALADGANGKAAAAFDAAAVAWAGFNEPRGVQCRWAAAEARRRGGATATAAIELRGVLEAAETMGYEPVAARARRSLRLLGSRVPGRPGGPATRLPGLTARERELIGLVERGLTNIEMARRLGLGQPTVARILASAMTKLGVSSRTQLAARGLT